MIAEILKKVRHVLPLMSVFLVLVVCMGLWLIFSINGNQIRDIYGEDGIWDLRDINFLETIVRVQGVEKEVRIETLETGNDVLSRRIRFQFPDEGWYMFKGTTFNTEHRLCVNGQWIIDATVLWEDRGIFTPNTSHIVFVAQATDGVIEIVEQINPDALYSHTNQQYWYVGNQNLLSHLRTLTFVSSLVASCFFALFLIYMILYLLQRDDLANLYFSLFSLTLFLRAIVTEANVVSAVVPWGNWYVKYRLEYVTIPAIACFLIAMVQQLLPGFISKYYRWSVYTMSAIFVVVFLIVDITSISQIMVIGYFLYFVAILYGIISGIVVAVRHRRKLNLEQYILLIGFFLVLMAILNDFSRHTRFQLLPDMPSMSVMASVYFCFCMLAAVLISNKKVAEAIKASEQQLALEVNTLAQLNQMKIDLMATLSHEVRTPLAVLASYSGLVAMELKNSKGSEQMIANLDKIVAESKRVANLIDTMNKIALNEEKTEEMRQIDLSGLIEQTTKLYYHMLEQDDIHLVLNLEEKLWVWANHEKLTQVLLNLLQNVKAHAAGGEVMISAKKQGSFAVVAVADTGSGVSSELLPFLFKRGVTSKKFGSGIGLAVCKEIICEHGGIIEIKSESSGENKGTTVMFTIPVVKDEGDKNGNM